MNEKGGGVGLWRLTVYNLLRRPGRSAVAVLAVVLAAATAFAGGLIGTGVSRALHTGLGRLGADLMVLPRGAAAATHTALVVGEPVAFYMDGAVTARVAAVPGVKVVSPQVYVETRASAACCTGRLFLVGFDPGSDFTVQPWLERQLGRSLGPDEVIAGNHVTMLPGQILKFYGTDFRVADRLEPSGMGMDETVFLPASAVKVMAERSLTEAEKPLQIPDGGVSAVMVRLADSSRAGEMASVIEGAVPGVTVLTGGDIARGVSRDLAGLMLWLLPVAGGTLLVSVLLFLVLFSATAAERAREIGLLRAMGATAIQAVTPLVGEALLLGVLGGALGVGAGLSLYAIFQDRILFSYVLPFLWPGALAEVLLATGVVAAAGLLGALAALLPARRIARLEPHFAIHAVGR
jgi:putative ABC transport system permease protein